VPSNRYEIAVAGVTFEGRQAILAELHQAQEAGTPLSGGSLRREPGNQYDANAIQARVEGQPIGCVPRYLAAKLAPRMDAGETAVVLAIRIIRGDHDHRVTYGARIDVEFPTEGGTDKCQPSPRLV
jgi:hypothetical protein